MPDVETELRRFLSVEADRYVPRDDVSELTERCRHRRRPVVLGAVAACLFVVVGAVAVVLVERGSSPGTTAATVPANAVRLVGADGNANVVITRPGDYALDGRDRASALLFPVLSVSPDVCDYLDVSVKSLGVVGVNRVRVRAVLHVDVVRRPVVLGYATSFTRNGAKVQNLTVPGVPPCLGNDRNALRKARALDEAGRLLALVPVGGEPYTGQLPKGMREPVMRPLTKNLIVEHREWTTTTPPDQVIAALRGDPPAGLQDGGVGSGSGQGQGTLYIATLVAAGTSIGGPSRHAVVVSAVTSEGRTIVRVDAEVVWLPARSAGEYAPFHTQAVVVNGRRITDATKVRALVDAFNREPTDTGAARSCPDDNGDRTRMEFVAPTGTHRIVVSAGFCGFVTVTVDGHTAVGLQDTEQLADLASGKRRA